MFSLFILSFIQSVTEFLPVSSSGHLYLLQFLGISEQGMGMDVLLHLGTLLAVICYFWSDIRSLLISLLPKQDKHLLINLIVATIPVMLVGLVFFELLNQMRLPMFVALNSIFWGCVLWLVDKYAPKKKNLKQLSMGGAFCIGCAQVLSLVPGTSRSGITITCARLLGLSRVESTRFSMLLSIPTISAAVAYVVYQGVSGKIEMPTASVGIGAILMTMIMGLMAIYFLMHWVKKSSFGIFALYRILLGLFILIYMVL